MKRELLAEKTVSTRPATRRHVRERAVELAATNGRSAHETSKSDWDRAKQELGGESDPDSGETVSELPTNLERWDSFPEANGYRTLNYGSDHQEDDGRSDNERLVTEGMVDAEQDRWNQAAMESDDT